MCVCLPLPPLPYSVLQFLVTAFSCFPSIASRLQYEANSAMETRRQREHQISSASKVKKPNNNSTRVSHSLEHFFANSDGQRTEFLDGKLYGGRKHIMTIFLSLLSKLGCALQEFSSMKNHFNIWTFELVGIMATTFEKKSNSNSPSVVSLLSSLAQQKKCKTKCKKPIGKVRGTVSPVVCYSVAWRH